MFEKTIKMLTEKGIVEHFQDSINKTACVLGDEYSQEAVNEGISHILMTEIEDMNESEFAIIFDEMFEAIVKELNITPDPDFKPDAKDRDKMEFLKILTKIL